MPGYFVRVIFARRYILFGSPLLQLPSGGLSYAQALAIQQQCLYETWGQYTAYRLAAGYYAIVSTPKHTMKDYEVYWCESNNMDELVGPIWQLSDAKAEDLLSTSILASATRGMEGDYVGFAAYVAEAMDPVFIDNRFYRDYRRCLRRIYSIGVSSHLFTTLCGPRQEPTDWWRTTKQSSLRAWISTEGGGYAYGGDDDIYSDDEPIPYALGGDDEPISC